MPKLLGRVFTGVKTPKNRIATGYKSGIDEIMIEFAVGRYRAREIWDIMQERNITMKEAYQVYISGKDIDEY